MKIKSLNKLIKENNAIFLGSTKAEKRVQIARDVLIRIKADKLQLQCGAFYTGATRERMIYHDKTDSIKDMLEGGMKCTVCAKGGLFMSYVGRVNNFSSYDLSQVSNSSDSTEHTKLLEIFSIRQLALIETAFEGEQYINVVDIPSTTYLKAIKYRKEYPSGNGRMTAICQNIIENNGTFKP